MGLMTNLAGYVWTASWQAAVIAMAVLLLHAMFGRWLTPRWRLALWSVVLLRMALLVTPPSAWSVFNVPPPPPPEVVRSVTPMVVESSPMVMPAALPVQETRTWTWPQIGATVWLGGTIAYLLTFITVGFITSRRIARLRSIQLPVMADCARVMNVSRPPRVAYDPRGAAPALFGLFSPTLLMPPNLDQTLSPQALRHVLMHELAHVKRWDLVKNWLIITLAAPHWFNPVLWFALRRCRADRELVCDAMVLERLDATEHRDYGRTLLDVLDGATAPRGPRIPGVTVGIGESFAQLRRRITAIAAASKPLRRWSSLGFALLLALSAVTLTDRQPPRALAQDEVKQPAIPAGRLDKPITVDFTDSRLDNVIDYLRHATGANIVVDWKQLTNVGIEREHPISITLKQPVPAERVLALVLEAASDGNELDPLGYAIDDGIVRVSIASVLPDRRTATRGVDVEANERVLKRLREKIPVNFNNVSLGSVIDYVIDTTGTNVHVHWVSLQNIGIDRDTPITLQLTDVTAATALKFVLIHASSGNESNPAGYAAIDGVITIAPHNSLLQRTRQVRVYDVRDLVSGEESVENIAQMIRSSVGRPEDWREFGGDLASVHFLNGNYVIHAPAAYHTDVTMLLKQLRGSKAPSEPLVVAIDKQGGLTVDGKAVTMQSLADDVVASDAARIVLRANTDTPYGTVIKVLDAVKQAKRDGQEVVFRATTKHEK